MHKSSYAIIGMTDEQMKVIRDAEEIQNTFYSVDKEIKQEIAISSGNFPFLSRFSSLF